MKKTPCFGECPEYELMIFEDRTVVIDAKQHLDLEGRYISKLSDERYHTLIEKFIEHDFFAFKDKYTSNVTDLPTTYVTFRHEGKVKEVMDYHGAPEALKELEKAVHQLIVELEWEKVKEKKEE
ncbi:MAG: DUF6438 domain-containing protein [Fulvivirga sp.]|nr:DUF6438 domain-containing protein [Fulvivirga sp.]